MRTVDYTDLKNRFTSALGVDSLLTSEETAFKRSLNDRVRGAWTRAKWPDLIRIVAKTAPFLGVTGKVQSEKGVVHLVADKLWIPQLDVQPQKGKSRDFH